jgi:hypothetical protein
MPFDQAFESDYIRRFAKMGRDGIAPAAYNEGIARIQKAFSEIPEPQHRQEACEHLTRIGNYGFIHIEDPKGSAPGIADEIDWLADFIGRSK